MSVGPSKNSIERNNGIAFRLRMSGETPPTIRASQWRRDVKVSRITLPSTNRPNPAPVAQFTQRCARWTRLLINLVRNKG